MALNEKAAKAARRRQALLDAGLTLLPAAAAPGWRSARVHGGQLPSGASPVRRSDAPEIQFEVLRAPGAPETVRLVLGQKAAA